MKRALVIASLLMGGVFTVMPAWGQEEMSGAFNDGGALQMHLPEEQAPETPENWSFHFQTTTVTQGHGDFDAAYSGDKSLSDQEETHTSFTSTAFLGRKLWQGGEAYVNPEMSAGSGLSGSTGIAAFPNGEIYRVSTPDAQAQISRVYMKQVFGFGGEQGFVEGDQNQLAISEDVSRLTVIAGKFSLNDFFDNNTYSHDPRTQFLNWALMDNGAWDYAADTRGYTWGVYVEFNQPRWALRAASVVFPSQANQMTFDDDLEHAHGDNVEFEYRYRPFDHPGKIRLLGFVNHAYMGNYQEAATDPIYNHDIVSTRSYSIKYGGGLNFEQELSRDVGLFGRLGWNDGHTETWNFTEIDNTGSVGLSFGGRLWGRNKDVMGLAYISNGLSDDHIAYLQAGGDGFILGDSNLNYGREQVFETYYAWNVWAQMSIAADYQFVQNPGYNEARGPVSIFGGRFHYEM